MRPLLDAFDGTRLSSRLRLGALPPASTARRAAGWCAATAAILGAGSRRSCSHLADATATPAAGRLAVDPERGRFRFPPGAGGRRRVSDLLRLGRRRRGAGVREPHPASAPCPGRRGRGDRRRRRASPPRRPSEATRSHDPRAISRESFDELKNYLGVYLQQGRAILDADWNESQDIAVSFLRRLAREAVGDGTPNPGFAIDPVFPRRPCVPEHAAQRGR